MNSKSQIQKVTDPAKIVTDPVLLSHLEKVGVDKDYVEFVQDYGKFEPGVSSPYSKLYRDLKSDQQFAVISQLPHADDEGNKIEVGWDKDGDSFIERNNLFRAKISDVRVELVTKKFQIDGMEAGLKLSYTPQLFIDNAEVDASIGPVLLDADPLNENYSENVLMWDYGTVKRFLRVIEGQVQGFWLRPVELDQQILIKYNQDGDYRLKLGMWANGPDTEFIPAKVQDDKSLLQRLIFQGVEYYLIYDTATYNPGADGLARANTDYSLWAGIVGANGDQYYDAQTSSLLYMHAGSTSSHWDLLHRMFFFFNTNGIPGLVTAATLSVRGSAKADGLGITPSLNVYGSSSSGTTSLAAADYQTAQATPFATAITYADYNTGDFNDFSLNASGIAAINVSGYSRFSIRFSLDVSGTPTWASGADSSFTMYMTEQGVGYIPKLVITYSVGVPTVTTQAAADVADSSCAGNGNITDTGGANPTRRGFCIKAGTTGDPTTADLVFYNDGSFGTGAFTRPINDLSPLSNYRVRAFAVNSGGTGYGATVQVTTLAMHPLKPRNVITLKVTDGVHELSPITQVKGIRPDYKDNELPSFEFTVPGNSQARPYFVDPNEVWLYRDGVLKDIFRITAPEKIRGRSTEITVGCQGIGYALKKSAVLSYSATATTTVHVTALLALQETVIFTIGYIDPTLDITFALALSKTDIWLALKEIQKTTGGHLVEAFDPETPSTRTISLLSTIGESTGQQIRTNKNLLSIKHRTDYVELFNKLYCYGTSGLALTTKTFTRVDAVKSSDATYGYLELTGLYVAYNGWTGPGNALPGSITVDKPGGSWVSPTSSSGWTGSTYAHDGNTSTACYYPSAFGSISPASYSAYLVLNIGATTTTQIRAIMASWPLPGEVDIYYGGGWHSVKSLGYFTGDDTISFGSQSITSIRIRFYNNTSNYYPVQVSEVYVWSTSGYSSDNAHWKQGADERTLRCAIADYDAAAPYVVSFTHAPYLIALDNIASRSQIYSKTHDFETADIDTLLAQGRVYLGDIKTAPVAIQISHIDLSVEAGRNYERLLLGSTISVIDEEMVIGESVPIVRLLNPDLGNHPERIESEIGKPTKTLIDSLKEGE